MRTVFRGKSEMNMFTKWMTLLLSIVTLGLAGCGESDKFYGETEATVDPGVTYSISVAATTSLVVGTSTSIVALMKDENDLPVQGASVTFIVDNGAFTGNVKSITAATDGDGYATATLTAPIKVGTGTVDATYGDQSASVNMNYLVGSASIISVDASPSVVGVSSQSTLTVLIMDQYTNPLANEAMQFTVSTPNSGSPVMELSGIATTNSSGIATAIYTSGISAGVTDVVSVTQFINPTISATTNIAVVASATSITDLSLGLSSASTAITVGDNTVTADAIIRDNVGEPIAGVNVAFQIVGTGDFGGVKSLIVATDVNGLASATLNAPILVGSATITAATAGLTSSIAVSYIPDVPDAITLSASPVTVGVSTDSSLTVSLFDQYGNVTPNEPVFFDITANISVGATLSNPTGNAQTNASGVATMTYTSGTTTGVIDTIQVSALNGSTPSTTADISVSASATSISSLSLALSSPTTSITVGTNTVTADATVLDNLGAPIAGVDVAFQIDGTGDLGGVKVITVATGATGVASATLNAPILVGSATITAATAGKTSSVSVTYIPDSPDNITLSISPATVGVSSDSTLTASLYDQYGNVTANEPVTFAITSNLSVGAVLSNPTGNAQTDASGIATMIYTSGTTTGFLDTVQVTALNGTAPNTTADISVSAAATSISSLNLALSSPTTSITVGTNTVTADATVLDNLGAAVDGVTVSFEIIGAGDIAGSKIATATTSGGVASVTLTGPDLVSTSSIIATAAGLSDSTVVNYIPDVPALVDLTASPASVGLAGTSTLTATVWDQFGNLTPNEQVAFSFGATASSPSFSPSTGIALTNASGVATMLYASGTLGTGNDNVVVTTVNGTPPTDTTVISVSTSSTNIGSLSMASGNASIIADGTSSTVIRATVKDTGGAVMEGVSVAFTSSTTTLSAASAVTDATGVAQVTLTSTTTLESASITASSGGFNASTTVNFIAGSALAANSSITVSPSTLPADGATTATVTVTLADANALPVTDGTPVTLLGMTGDAAVTSNNPASTVSGRATFTLKAASASATDTLYLAENSAITGSVTYGATGTGNPANVLVSSSVSSISVAGLGQTENATITITVVDEGGTLIADPAYNNLRVSLLTRPNGGEYVSGINFAGTTVTTVGGAIDVVTSSGQAVLTLQSGTLPGIVEIKLEVYDDTPAPTGVTAVVPQIVIASGPAHSIAFGRPITGAVTNLGAGNYQRIGSVTVTDRYGNSVADGSVVNLGIIDSIIVDDRGAANGITNPGSSSLGDGSIFLTDGTAVDYTTASITRNNTTRSIQENDRVLIFNAVAEDKSRHVATGATANVLPVQTAYTATNVAASYVVGAATLGGAIFGVDPADGTTLTPGYVSTIDGIGEIRIDYPAKRETILIGCGRSVPDTRHLPDDSADTYVVASVSGTDATSITGEYCFSAIAGYAMTTVPSSISGGAVPVVVSLVDGGDTIPLPFVDVSSSVVITTNTGGMTVGVSTCDASSVTDVSGSCTATVTIGGTPATGDAATVSFFAGDASADVTITIP